MTDLANDSSSPSPSVTWEDWEDRVTEDLGIADLSRLRDTLPEGLEIEALYAPENAAPVLPRPGKARAGWESWATFDLDAPASQGESLEDLESLGAAGLWLRPSPSTRASRVSEVLRSVTELGLEVGVLGGAPAAALVAAAWSGEITDLRGALGIDPYPREGAVEIPFLIDSMTWVRSEAPGIRPFLLSSEIPEEAGAGAVHELAWLAAGSVDLLRRLEGERVDPEEAIDELVWLVPVGRDVYLQIAKLRAARILWSMILGGADLSAGGRPLRLAARTSWRTKSRWDAKTNLLRETVEAFAAVAGGCDSLTCRSFDGGRSDLGRRLRLTLPLVLREEGRLDRVEDPAGGSWYVESLTRRLAEGAWEELRRIEGEGGLAASLESGSLVSRIEASGDRRKAEIRHRREPVVGISIYPVPGQRPGREPRDLPSRSPAASWRDLRRSFRDGARYGELAKRGSRSETSGALEPWSDPSPFERLWDRAARRDGGPRAVLTGIGSLRELSTLSSSARQLLVAGGFRVEEPDPFETAEEARGSLRGSDADLVVLVLPREMEEESRRRAVRSIRPEVSGILAVHGPEEPVEGVDPLLTGEGDAVALLEDLWGKIEG